MLDNSGPDKPAAWDIGRSGYCWVVVSNSIPSACRERLHKRFDGENKKAQDWTGHSSSSDNRQIMVEERCGDKYVNKRHPNQGIRLTVGVIPYVIGACCWG